MSSINNDYFTSFHCGCLLFLLVWFLCLVLSVLSWARVVKMDIPALFLILREMVSFSPIGGDVDCVTVIHVLYYVEVCYLYSYFAESFCHKWVVDFIKCFVCIYWFDHMVFILHFDYVVYLACWFSDIVLTLHPQNKFHLIMMYDLFNVLVDSVC